MGLNKKCISKELGARFYSLLKRIWWTLYCRNILTRISGLDNGRLLQAEECDTLALTEDDWHEDDSICPRDLLHVLPAVEKHHKDFLTQLCKFAAIGSSAHGAVLSYSAIDIDRTTVMSLADDIYEWRLALPRPLRTKSVRDWKNEGIWVLVIMAWCYRLECMIFRSWRKAHTPEDEVYEHITESLHRAIFELDAVIRRAISHRVCQLLPMSFSTVVATLIALCIELLKQPGLRQSDKLVSEEAIRIGINFLVASQMTWPSLRLMFKMFDWAFAQAGLNFNPGNSPLNQGVTDFSHTMFSEDSLWDLTSSHIFGPDFMLNTNDFATW